MNPKRSVFIIGVEVIMYLLLALLSKFMQSGKNISVSYSRFN